MAEKISKEEFEKKVIELAKSGMTSEKIGLELKKEKINAKNYEKISKVLKKNNLYISPDSENLKKTIAMLEKHSKIHAQDKTCKISLSRKSAKLRKLAKKR